MLGPNLYWLFEYALAILSACKVVIVGNGTQDEEPHLLFAKSS
jgi:hypothetical protein